MSPSRVYVNGMPRALALEVAHGRLCERGSRILNEKRLLAEAGLGEVDALLVRGCGEPFELVTAISGVLNIEPISRERQAKLVRTPRAPARYTAWARPISEDPHGDRDQ